MYLKFLLPLLLLSFREDAQMLTIIDIKLKVQITYSDSFSVDQFFSDKFPVYYDDTDSIIKNLYYVSTMINQNISEPLEKTIVQGHSQVSLRIEKIKEVLFYSLYLKTNTGGKSFSFDVLHYITNKRKAQLQLTDLIDYLESRPVPVQKN